jgi:hypothetical protein
MKAIFSERAATFAMSALLALISVSPVHAEVRSKSNDIIVLQPTDLPEQAKTPGNSFFLYSDNDGSTYLYIEQEQGARLTTFNVTDPSKIKFVSSTMLTLPGAFDFVRPVGGRAELIRFRRQGCRRPRSAYCKKADGEDHLGLVRVRFYRASRRTGIHDDQRAIQLHPGRPSRLPGDRYFVSFRSTSAHNGEGGQTPGCKRGHRNNVPARKGWVDSGPSTQRGKRLQGPSHAAI